MKFGPVAIGQAQGAILAHAVQAGSKRLPKARRLSEADIGVLRAAGVGTIVVATLDAEDLDENSAATAIARAIRATAIEVRPAATGRVNLHAIAAGVFTVERGMVDAINAVDPAITIATLSDNAAVQPGQMVATVKIIPFAVAVALIQKVETILVARVLFEVHRFSARRVGLIQTVLPSVKASVLAKTRRVTESRLARSASAIASEERIAHETTAVAGAIARALRDHDMAIVFGASAMCDFDDIVPAAIRLAGGEVIRAGMPVDPGNLLVLGQVGGKTVVGAPGCARSPKENGFDWVLDRLIAGIDVTASGIAGMGVGGLLLEIAARPQPRESQHDALSMRVDAIVLAAGRSSRMGGPNKLLAHFDGVALIRRVTDAALSSRAASVRVVVGHQADRVRQALAGLDAQVIDNPDFADGLASSLKAGISSLNLESSGALILLGDMPQIGPADLDRLIAAFQAAGGARIVRATDDGKRGNPVILPRSVFPAVARLEGDTGARHLVEQDGPGVIDIEIGAGASVDVDTADAVAAAGGVLTG